MGKIYSYNRISTNKQSIERQHRNALALYSNVIIVDEVFTGTKIEGRKEWTKLLSKVKEGDTIVFDSVSRMSRSAEEAFEEHERLYNREVDLVFIKEPHINTATYKDDRGKQIQLTDTMVDDIPKGINK